MATRPTALFIGVGAPWTGGAGYLVRQDMLLRALSEVVGPLRLAMFDLGPKSKRPPFECELVSLPHPRRFQEPHWRSLMNDVISSRPMGLRTLDCGITRAAVEALRPHEMDAVIAYRCDFAYMAGVLGHRNLILDIDDPEHVRRAEAARVVDDGNHHWQRRLELRRLRRFELNAARDARACFVCQQHDALAFGDIAPIVVPNCVEVPASRPLQTAASPNVLFVGNLDASEHSPNVDAVRWFLRETWPLLRQRMPMCEFKIAGPIRAEWREEARHTAGVRVLGFVSDLPALLKQASVLVAPIRFGTGTRIKVIESMAWGCPVVSTAKGCEGLDVAHNEHLLVADSPPELSESCLRVMRDERLAQRLSENGWLLASNRYDRRRNQHTLAALLGRLVVGGRGAAREAA